MRKRKSNKRMSKRFAAILKAEERVVADFKYWLIHIFHWHALFFTIAGGLYIGYMFSAPSRVDASLNQWGNDGAQDLVTAPLPMAKSVTSTQVSYP